MSDNRPSTEKELLAHLSDTIGEETFQRMQGVDWKTTEAPPPQIPVNPVAEGSPQAAAPTGSDPANPVPTPAPAPASTPVGTDPVAGTTSVDWNQFRDNNGLILGKYPSAEAAVKGMHSLIHMANDSRRQIDELSRQNAELTRQISTPKAAEPSIPLESSPELERVLAQIGEDGMTPELAKQVASAMSAQAAQIAERSRRAEREVEQSQQRAWQEVDNYMSRTFPSSVRFVDEMNLFRQQDSLTDKAVSALLSREDRQGAMELLWRNYAASIGMDPKTSPTVLDPAAQAQDQRLQVQKEVRKEEVDAARKDAGLLPTGASGVHETPDVGASQEEIDAAGRRMQATGLGEQWRALTIVPKLSGPWFDN